VEGDAMAAGYFWAAAAATGGRVRVENVGSRSLQGDRRFADVLGEMGCDVTWTETTCEVRAPGERLQGGTFDLNDMSDQAQTLAVLGLITAGPVRIENVWNMRIKETDRLAAMATELRKFGAVIEEEHDALTVHPPESFPQRVAIDTYGDHRMAMALAVAGLAATEVEIRDPACVAKTYPDFFEDLSAVIGRST
jgi:3-phosphoshikimate 1-carboxyvinyltransferase